VVGGWLNGANAENVAIAALDENGTPAANRLALRDGPVSATALGHATGCFGGNIHHFLLPAAGCQLPTISCPPARLPRRLAQFPGKSGRL
jgi:hypothetical protein